MNCHRMFVEPGLAHQFFNHAFGVVLGGHPKVSHFLVEAGDYLWRVQSVMKQTHGIDHSAPSWHGWQGL